MTTSPLHNEPKVPAGARPQHPDARVRARRAHVREEDPARHGYPVRSSLGRDSCRLARVGDPFAILMFDGFELLWSGQARVRESTTSSKSGATGPAMSEGAHSTAGTISPRRYPTRRTRDRAPSSAVCALLARSGPFRSRAFERPSLRALSYGSLRAPLAATAAGGWEEDPCRRSPQGIPRRISL